MNSTLPEKPVASWVRTDTGDEHMITIEDDRIILLFRVIVGKDELTSTFLMQPDALQELLGQASDENREVAYVVTAARLGHTLGEDYKVVREVPQSHSHPIPLPSRDSPERQQLIASLKRIIQVLKQ